MSTLLRVDNFASRNIKERIRLSADVAAAATALTVENNQGATVDYPVLIGPRGREQTELRRVLSVAGASTINLSAALSFAHVSGDEGVILFGDQIKVYRAANVDGRTPADASFAAFLASPVNIDFDQLMTDIQDPSGSSSYWYKFSYYNSTTTDETSLADSIAVRGGGFGHYASVDAIRDEAGFSRNENIKDATIATYRDRAESIINSKLHGFYTLPLSSPIPGNITAITVLLAAGLLMNKEYGAMNTGGTSTEGKAKVDDAMAMLTELVSGDATITDQADTGLDTSDRVSGYPDDSEDAGDFKFTMEDVY
jgi:hypothetical protein